MTQNAVGSKLGQQNTIERPLQGAFFGRSTQFLTSRQPGRHLHRHLCCVACGSRRPPFLASPTAVPWVGATLERSVRALSAEKREVGVGALHQGGRRDQTGGNPCGIGQGRGGGGSHGDGTDGARRCWATASMQWFPRPGVINNNALAGRGANPARESGNGAGKRAVSTILG